MIAPASKESARTAPRSNLSGYIPSLDGWRALAVLFVISVHDKVHKLGFLTSEIVHREGHRGVNLFFAISGILICSRLLEEERRFGKISLRGFYIRRVCRIQPAAMLYLAVVGALALLHCLPLSRGAFLSAVLYCRNYYPFHGALSNATEFTNHFWSLSVEEHFYLLFPLFLVICVRRRAMILAAVAFLLAAWNGVVANTPALQFGPTLAWRTDIALNEILIPALIAILLARPDFFKACVRLVNPWSSLLLAVVFSVIARAHLPLLSPVAQTLVYSSLLLGTVLHPESLLSRLLETSPLRFIGRISFSLYLWQQLFFTGTYTGPPPLGPLNSFPLNFVALFSLATLTYYFVEKPMIRLGHHLAPPASPGRSDLGALTEPGRADSHS